MARDYPHSRVRHASERYGNDMVRHHKLPQRVDVQTHKPLPIREVHANRAALPIEFLNQLNRVEMTKWSIEYETPSGQNFIINHDHLEPKEMEKQADMAGIVDSMQVGAQLKVKATKESDSKGSRYSRAAPKKEKRSSSPRAGSHSFHVARQKKRSHASSTASAVKRSKPTIVAESDDDDQNTADEESDSDDVPDEPDDDFEGLPKSRRAVRADEIKHYYRLMFMELRQKGCKKILVTWLKTAHPKKQASNPYNGGAGADKLPNFDKANKGLNTAPDYWLHQKDWKNPHSTGCRHREPDHTKKWERLNLAVHLLSLGDTYLPKHDFTVDALEESTKDITKNHSQHFPKGADAMIQQIYDARRMEGQFLDGKIRGDTTISLNLPDQSRAPVSQVAKKGGRSQLMKQELNDHRQIDQIEEGQSHDSPSAMSDERLAVKSEKPQPGHRMITSDINAASYTPRRPSVYPNYAVNEVAHVNLGMALPSDHIVDPHYHTDLGNVSSQSSRSGSQASHSQGSLSSLPMQRQISGQSPQYSDTCMRYNGSRFPKEIPMATVAHHQLQSNGALEQHLHHHQKFEESNGPHDGRHARPFPQQNAPTHLGMRPKLEEIPYASSDLVAIQTYGNLVSTAYPPHACAVSSGEAPMPYDSVVPPGAGQADYSPYGVADHDDSLYPQVQPEWYPTHVDMQPAMDMMGQVYGSVPSFDLAPHPNQPQQAERDMLVSRQHMLAAQEWAPNSYSRGGQVPFGQA